MLLSRFWYVFLALATAAALAAALLAQAVINTRSDEALAEALQRDRTMADTMLRLEARSRLDRIAFITVDAKLGALLKQAQGISDSKKLVDLNAAVKGLLRSHLGRMVDAARDEGSADGKRRDLEPDIAFALDLDGRIIAQLGPLEAMPPGSSLAGFPLVKRALQGYLRDDVWVYDRKVYRMAARPVMAGSDYAGAILHGYRLEKGLTEKLSGYLGGASVGFFYGNDLLGGYAPGEAGSPQPPALAAALPAVLKDPKFQSGERTPAFDLSGGGRALVAKITGSAAGNGVGYIVARPHKLLTRPQQLFEQASTDDVNALPMVGLVLCALLLAGIGLGFVYIERDRHLRLLLRKTADIAAGQRERLIVTDWRGKYRLLADRINQAIEKEVERAGGDRTPRKKANLDEILGPTPEANVTPFFAFADDPSGAAAGGPQIAGAQAGAATSQRSQQQPGARAPAAGGAHPASGIGSAATHASGAAAATAGGRRSLVGMPAVAPTAAQAPGGREPGVGAGPAAGAARSATSNSLAGMPAVAARSATSSSLAGMPAAAAGTAARTATSTSLTGIPVVSTPLSPTPEPRRSVPGASPSLAPREINSVRTEDSDFDEDAHFREVYEQYVQTRKQCGESIDSLSFDKFALTLRKTRDQVVEKQGARSVRFLVHVKDGKAALKAQPLKR